MQGDTATPGSWPREKRVYRHSFRWLSILLGSLCALAAAYSVAFGLANGNPTNVVFGLTQLPMVVLAFLLGWVLRVETSPEGLAYHNMGFYTVRAGWEDVDRITGVPFRGMGRVECILLRRSTVRGWTGPAWAVPKADRGLTIPLGKSWSSWSSVDDLRREVLRNAPRAVG